jgi:hypothetical protein
VELLNEKPKRIMNDQKSRIFNNLKNEFNLPVFEDEIAEDEDEKLLDSNAYNCFVFETSDFHTTNNIGKLSQDIHVFYYSENQDDVDEKTIDIISVITSIKAISFSRSVKERLKVKETDRYLDRVTLAFKRVIPIDYQV